MDDLPSEDVQAAIEVERRIKKRYLGESETNLRPAVHEALRRLYSLPRLPANPTSSSPPRSPRTPRTARSAAFGPSATTR